MLEEQKKEVPSRFQRHVSILMWKSYNQRQRRWRLLVLETLIAGVLFLVAVYCAKPVFLTPLQAEPEAPKTSSELLASLHAKTDLYYTPAVEPFTTYMKYAARLLNINLTGGKSEEALSNILYNRTKGSPITNPVVWVVWKPKRGNQFRISIRSTERARHHQVHLEGSLLTHQHLRAGFLAVQLAISEAIIKLTTKAVPEYEFSLVAMPVSPLMEKTKVNHSISWIMLCFTLAFVPPVMDLVLLVVKETTNGFKRGLRIRNVGYPSMYIGWLVYAYLTALPICILATITIIFIFRWTNLVFTLFFIFSYISVMIMISLNMAMFHKNPWVACVWNALLTLLQTFLAELLVHHRYEEIHTGLTFLLNIVLPPLALVHGFNNFALLQTGHGSGASAGDLPLSYTITLWCVLILLYFGILILLQRTIGRQRAIGGQVSWKSIIFKQAKDENALRYIETPTGKERDNLQEVDDLVAKAITFRDVSKSIMDEPVLKNLTLDIYRSEFTLLYTERINEVVPSTLEDLLLGLTFPDNGTINVLGQNLNKGRNFVTMTQMLGYCHSSKFLIEDLSVQEHLLFFMKLCLWQESRQFIVEYSHMRLKRLLSEFDLEEVRDAYIGDLHSYYRAQLCWAIAMLLEPRIVVIPYQFDDPICKAVTNDKIMKYKKRVTLVKLEFASYNLEFADRFFIFNNKTLVFGGTPAYMFFKYGREYRVRLSFRSGLEEEVSMRKLLDRAEKAGASVRAHLGSLLILRVPATPTAIVAELMQEFTTKASTYGITSMNLSLPDSEEVCRRAIIESRAAAKDVTSDVVTHRDNALKKISEARVWKREETRILNRSQFEKVAWKFTTFYLQHKIALIVTVMAAIVTGAFIGYSLAKVLLFIIEVHSTNTLLHGEVLTVESLKMKTTLVIRSDMSDDAFSVAHGYVLSETFATEEEIKNMQYSALSDKESLTEYLVTRAIHSPQHYVYMYAYGMDIALRNRTHLRVQALYSPLHWDQASAARSMSRVFMALLRYYSGQLDASIEITDDPLELDLTPGMKQALLPPLLVQFLLILTISHVTLIPSQEHGLIRHLQSHAGNFCPVKYWFNLFVCDMILYWILVGLMAVSMVTTMLIILPMKYFHYEDLLAVPLTLIIYGLGCIPQAYLFSLGPRPALNTMTFLMVNVVFGETTILAKLLYGDLYNYAVNFMSLSPQFNMAIAFVKIKQIFLYNSECVIFKHKAICSSKILHKCCEKCGVMQECFSKQCYFGAKYGVLMEIIATLSTAVMYATLLLLWEYKYIQQAWYTASAKWMKGPAQTSSVEASPQVAPGVKQEIELVVDKMDPIHKKNSQKIDTFGENLLACNVGKISGGVRIVRNLFLGLARGEAVALSGLKRHGRVQMCEVLAGYKLPSEGVLWSKSKWNVKSDPHLYAREISFCGEDSPLPPWMTVRDGLELLAVLRGVPNKYVRDEVNNYIEAVDLSNEAQMLIRDLARNDKTRLHFAAAVVAAPPVVILDECTAYQKFSVRRTMYSILFFLRQRGHSILTASSSVESHLPVTNRLAILLDGYIYDIDHVDRLVERNSRKGYTVVLHLKDEVDVKKIFAKYFTKFVINDLTVVLVNVQVLEGGLNWGQIFARMESLQAENSQVYSYIVSATPIEYVYNSILSREEGNAVTSRPLPCALLQKLVEDKPKIAPPKATLDKLVPFDNKYDITNLKELPWSVIFQR